jgi:hypothetical protein
MSIAWLLLGLAKLSGSCSLGISCVLRATTGLNSHDRGHGLDRVQQGQTDDAQTGEYKRQRHVLNPASAAETTHN